MDHPPGPPSATAADLAYALVSEDLKRGIYRPGSRILGERRLASDIGVSRATLRQALTRLAEEGLLHRSSQRGWFVPRPPVGEPPSVLQSFSEMARSRGLVPTSHVLESDVRPATLAESEQLRVAPAAPVLHLRRLRGMDEVPVCLEASVLVAARVAPLIEADLENASLFEALAELCDVHVWRSSYAIQAMGASPVEAKLLGIDNGAPLLVGHEATYDSEGTPIVCSRTAYRGDAYRFQADLYRSAPAAAQPISQAISVPT